jgi:predicted AAA+ superfamily ATPase
VSNAISFFERSFIVRLLQPWYSNIGKRLIKSPKIYIRDSGIVNHMLGITEYDELLRHPFIGSLWEGYVFQDIMNTLTGEFQFYYYRTADGTECDLVIFKGNRCIAAIDTKFSPNPGRSKSMTITIQDLHPQKAFFVVPECPAPYLIDDKIFVATPWKAIEMIRSL